MTPKQKQQRAKNIEMMRFLGFTGDYAKYSDAHLRKLIESKKIEILKTLGIDATNGLKQIT
jgi:hypothetical protein